MWTRPNTNSSVVSNQAKWHCVECWTKNTVIFEVAHGVYTLYTLCASHTQPPLPTYISFFFEIVLQPSIIYISVHLCSLLHFLEVYRSFPRISVIVFCDCFEFIISTEFSFYFLLDSLNSFPQHFDFQAAATVTATAAVAREAVTTLTTTHCGVIETVVELLNAAHTHTHTLKMG